MVMPWCAPCPSCGDGCPAFAATAAANISITTTRIFPIMFSCLRHGFIPSKSFDRVCCSTVNLREQTRELSGRIQQFQLRLLAVVIGLQERDAFVGLLQPRPFDVAKTRSVYLKALP